MYSGTIRRVGLYLPILANPAEILPRWGGQEKGSSFRVRIFDVCLIHASVNRFHPEISFLSQLADSLITESRGERIA